MFLPSTLEGGKHYGSVVLDRTAVFVLGFGTAYGTAEILKHALARRRPNGEDSLSRPSSHATAGFTTMAFLSNVLRDTLEPEKESDLWLRIIKEVTTALPYLGAGYLALERVHGKDHFRTDTLLGGAIGAFTMNMFYAWSFTRSKYGSSWFQRAFRSATIPPCAGSRS
ncbi:MAG: phosphatase PAP2 family protein [Candidatus Rokuibacteriota bacterium]